MYSFFNLVKNEYIKIYKKTSTRIMLVIFLAVCICFAPLMKLINHFAIQAFGGDFDEISYVQETLEDAKNDLDKKEDDPLKEERAALIEVVDPESEWQFQGYISAMASNDKQKIQRMTMLCKLDDWRGFCQYMTDNAISQGDQWAYSYRLEHEIAFTEEFEKQNRVIDQVAMAMNGMAETGLGSSGLSASDQIAIGKYQLENGIYDNTSTKGGSLLNIDPTVKMDFWAVYLKTPFVVTLIGVIMVVVAGSIVAGEFSQGTIKFLLINPVSRGKILMAKYVTVMSLGLLLIIALMLINIPMIGIFFGFDGFTAPYLYVKDGEVLSHSSFIYLFKSYMLASCEIIVTTTLSFMISSMLRSTALAIVAGFLTRSIGPSVVQIMAMLKMDWGRYLIFANTDLLSISNGESVFQQHTVTFALGVVAAHLIVFLLTAWDGFTRRSV